jgi:hypothetical protein
VDQVHRLSYSKIIPWVHGRWTLTGSRGPQWTGALGVLWRLGDSKDAAIEGKLGSSGA